MKIKIKLTSQKLFGKRGKKIDIELDESWFRETQSEYIKNVVIEDKVKKLVNRELSCGGWEIVK